MPSTYSPSLRLELIGAGEQAGTWNTTTNTNLGTLLDQAIAGYTTVSVTSANQAFTALDGAADEARNAVIELTTTTTANFAVYAPPQEKTYIIYNNTAYTATIYNSTVLGNTTAAGTGVTVAAGNKTMVFTNATNFSTLSLPAPGSGTVTSVGGTGSVNGLTLTGTVTTSGNLTLGGTLSNVSMGSVVGTLAVANGGTGSSSLAAAGIVTTAGGQTIAGTLTTTGDISSGSGRVVTNELFIATSSAFGPYGAKGNLLWNGAVQNGFVMKSTSSVDSNCMIFLNSSDTPLGSIFLKPSINECTFNNLSDYRLKHTIAPMTGALEKVALLKPCTFKWKNNDAESQGFIAHELQEVVPQCVSGEKDAVNEDGSIIPQGVDPRYLVATLTAAIQELKALVDVQAARITALES